MLAAVQEGDLDTVLKCLEDGYDLSTTYSVGIFSIMINHLATVSADRSLLSHMQSDWTALGLAVRNDHLAVVEALLQAGADFNFDRKVLDMNDAMAS